MILEASARLCVCGGDILGIFIKGRSFYTASALQLLPTEATTTSPSNRSLRKHSASLGVIKVASREHLAGAYSEVMDEMREMG